MGNKIKRTLGQLSIKDYLNEEKSYDVDLALQRNEVWNNDKRSLLIHTILIDFPIPALYLNKDKKKYLVLDGKQRLSSIKAFRNGKFKIAEDSPPVDGISLKGKFYNDLSPELQQRFNDYVFDIILLDEITVEQRDTIFYRFNNGEQLTRFEITKALNYGSSMEKIFDISKYKFFAEKVNLSSVEKSRMLSQELVIQTIMMLNEADPSFDYMSVRKYAEKLKEDGIPEETISLVKETSDYLNKAFSGKAIKEPVPPKKPKELKPDKANYNFPEAPKKVEIYKGEDEALKAENKAARKQYSQDLEEYKKQKATAKELLDADFKKYEEYKEKYPELVKKHEEDLKSYKKLIKQSKGEYLKKTHVPMIFLCASRAKEYVAPVDFVKWLNKFFEDNQKGAYSNASVQGSAKQASVKTRKTMMLASFEDTFGDKAAS